MSPESAPEIEPAPTRMSEISRVTGVFFEPMKAFTDIAERPRFWAPLLLLILGGLVFFGLYGQHVGWDRFLRHQMETNARLQQQMAQIPPERRDATLEMQAKFTGIGYYVGTAIMTPVMFLISAGILLGVASGMMSAGIRFKQVFSLVCYANLPILIKHALAVVVMFIKNPDDYNLVNPLAFNPAAFMDPVNSSKFLYTAGTYFDVFFIWTIVLTAIGLKAAAGKRMSFGGAVFAAIVPWALGMLFAASMAAKFS